MVAFFLVFSLSYLPGPEVEVEVIRPEKKRADKGLYVTYYVAQTPRRFNYIKEQAKKSGLNTLVVDAKHVLSKPLLELLKNKKLTPQTKVEPDPWVSDLVNELHKEGFIVSVRLVVFKDDQLVLARPDLGVKLKDGNLYRDLKGGKWADPYSDEVRLYNTLIAERAALSGVDEVQFDYIRFPAERRAHLARYPFKKEGVGKVDIISQYLEEAQARLKKYNVSIAVDIFGVIAWQRKSDIESLGQDLKRMAPYIDVISPMLYPSHFAPGYDGHANPGENPYYFLYSGVERVKEILSGEAVAIVPWLQGFNLRSPNFGPGYINAQIKACLDAGTSKYLVWNARNDYWATFSALKK